MASTVTPKMIKPPKRVKSTTYDDTKGLRRTKKKVIMTFSGAREVFKEFPHCSRMAYVIMLSFFVETIIDHGEKYGQKIRRWFKKCLSD